MEQDRFSCVIKGAGLAGLSLAWELLHSANPIESLMFVDRRHPLEAPNRPYSFWSKYDLPFSSVVKRSWGKIHLRTASWESEMSMAPYKFHMVYFHDYAEYLFSKIIADKRVTFKKELPEDYAADWIFDSTYPKDLPASTFYMYSMGWEVKTDSDYFRPDVMTFCDFPRGVAPGTFYYALPFSSRHAIVYYVQWSLHPKMNVEVARQALAKYINVSHKCTDEEYGVIPLFIPTTRKSDDRTLTIGLRGGLVRACTGYGLTRIWQDSRDIVQSLEKNGNPFVLPKTRWTTQLGDYAFRYLIKNRPQNTQAVLGKLFKNNSVPDALDFLEGNSLLANLPRTMLKVTPWPFLMNRFS